MAEQWPGAQIWNQWQLFDWIARRYQYSLPRLQAVVLEAGLVPKLQNSCHVRPILYQESLDRRKHSHDCHRRKFLCRHWPVRSYDWRVPRQFRRGWPLHHTIKYTMISLLYLLMLSKIWITTNAIGSHNKLMLISGRKSGIFGGFLYEKASRLASDQWGSFRRLDLLDSAFSTKFGHF